MMKSPINLTQEAASELILEFGMKDAKRVAVCHIREETAANIAVYWDRILNRLARIENATTTD